MDRAEAEQFDCLPSIDESFDDGHESLIHRCLIVRVLELRNESASQLWRKIRACLCGRLAYGDTPYFSPRLSARVKQDELDVRRNARFVEDRGDESSMRECLEQSRRRIVYSEKRRHIPEGISRVVADSRAILKV